MKSDPFIIIYVSAQVCDAMLGDVNGGVDVDAVAVGTGVSRRRAFAPHHLRLQCNVLYLCSIYYMRCAMAHTVVLYAHANIGHLTHPSDGRGARTHETDAHTNPKTKRQRRSNANAQTDVRRALTASSGRAFGQPARGRHAQRERVRLMNMLWVK